MAKSLLEQWIGIDLNASAFHDGWGAKIEKYRIAAQSDPSKLRTKYVDLNPRTGINEVADRNQYFRNKGNEEEVSLIPILLFLFSGVFLLSILKG